jgi:hypothetical protein
MTEFSLRTFMRRRSAGPHGSEAAFRFCNLGDRQPLVLHREPHNPYDSNAVNVTDLYGQRVGFVAREDAGIVSAKIASGLILLCRTDGPCECYARSIYIWSEGEKAEEVKKKAKTVPRRGRVLVPAGGALDDLPPGHEWE